MAHPPGSRAVIRQGTCNRHPLLLTPRQVLRLVGETCAEAKPREELTSALTLLALGDGVVNSMASMTFSMALKAASKLNVWKT